MNACNMEPFFKRIANDEEFILFMYLYKGDEHTYSYTYFLF